MFGVSTCEVPLEDTMKTLLLTLTIFLFTPAVHAQISAGFSFDSDGLNEFYLSIGRHYHVPVYEVQYVHHHYGIPFDEVPVVYFIAHHAGISPWKIVKLRRRGYSWMRICTRYHLSPAIFYMPVRYYGTGCGVAFGHFHQPRHHWHHLHFSDYDVINMVNIRFASEYYGYEPDNVIRVRDNGFHYADMHRSSFDFERATRTRDRDEVFRNNGSARTRELDIDATRSRDRSETSVDRSSTRTREIAEPPRNDMNRTPESSIGTETSTDRKRTGDFGRSDRTIRTRSESNSSAPSTRTRDNTGVSVDRSTRTRNNDTPHSTSTSRTRDAAAAESAAPASRSR